MTVSVLVSYDTGKTLTDDVTSNKFGCSMFEEPETTKMYIMTGVDTSCESGSYYVGNVSTEHVH